MFTSILCPVDFSPHSERALGLALELAELSGAVLTIMTAVDPFLDLATSASGHADVLMRQTQDEMTGLLERTGLAARSLTRPPAISIVTGNAAEEIIKLVAEYDADLVVMGTQGLSGARRLVFGSTTEKVLRESMVPVLAVPMPTDATASRLQ